MNTYKGCKHIPALALILCLLMTSGCPPTYTAEEKRILEFIQEDANQKAQNTPDNKGLCTKAWAIQGVLPIVTLEEGESAVGTKESQFGGTHTCFVGEIIWTINPYTGDGYHVYTEGVLVESIPYTKEAKVNEGRFLYLSPGPGEIHGGTYVMVGRQTKPNGQQTTGIFIADKTQYRMEFVPADEPYLRHIEEKHKRQVEAYKEEQRKRQAEDSGGLSFGQALALGLGGAAILGAGDVAGLSKTDMAIVGGAMAADILTDGEAGALDKLRKEQAGAASQSGAGGSNGRGSVTCDGGKREGICVQYTTSPDQAASIKADCQSRGHQARDGHSCPAGNSCITSGGKGTTQTFIYSLTSSEYKPKCEGQSGRFVQGPETADSPHLSMAIVRAKCNEPDVEGHWVCGDHTEDQAGYQCAAACIYDFKDNQEAVEKICRVIAEMGRVECCTYCH